MQEPEPLETLKDTNERKAGSSLESERLVSRFVMLSVVVAVVQAHGIPPGSPTRVHRIWTRYSKPSTTLPHAVRTCDALRARQAPRRGPPALLTRENKGRAEHRGTRWIPRTGSRRREAEDADS